MCAGPNVATLSVVKPGCRGMPKLLPQNIVNFLLQFKLLKINLKSFY